MQLLGFLIHCTSCHDPFNLTTDVSHIPDSVTCPLCRKSGPLFVNMRRVDIAYLKKG